MPHLGALSDWTKRVSYTCQSTRGTICCSQSFAYLPSIIDGFDYPWYDTNDSANHPGMPWYR